MQTIVSLPIWSGSQPVCSREHQLLAMDLNESVLLSHRWVGCIRERERELNCFGLPNPHPMMVPLYWVTSSLLLRVSVSISTTSITVPAVLSYFIPWPWNKFCISGLAKYLIQSDLWTQKERFGLVCSASESMQYIHATELSLWAIRLFRQLIYLKSSKTPKSGRSRGIAL